jgi:hypothetical protein
LRICVFALGFHPVATTIKAAAIHWLNSKFGATGNAVHASKLYTPEKSRTQQLAWWIEIPLQEIETPKSEGIDLLCEMSSGANKFYYLKVPVVFFKKELSKLCVRKDGRLLSLFLSAEPDEMFVEQRGSGRIGFSRFLMTR